MTDEAYIHVDTNKTIKEDGSPPEASSRSLLDLLDFQWKASLAATTVARTSHDHGPRHWRDVARVGLKVGTAMELRPAYLLPVFFFAAVHDTQRQSEFHDPEHGERAAEIMKMLVPPNPIIKGDVERELHRALCEHDKGGVEEDVWLVQACWDADRLTIGRVGITPMVEYMSSYPVRNDFDRFVEMADAIRTGKDMDWQKIAEMYSRV